MIGVHLDKEQDMKEFVDQLVADHAVTLDGAIEKNGPLESAALWTPDGYMIALMKQPVWEEEKVEEELTPREQELWRILDSMKL